MHGTADDTIAYEGAAAGPLGIGAYAGALVSAQNIARRAGCDTTGTAGAELDLMASLNSTETTTLAFDTGCRAGADAALWTLRGGTHIPVINPAGTRAALTWLLRHDRTP
jgi:polyhydroxybutyrate depolymerase